MTRLLRRLALGLFLLFDLALVLTLVAVVQFFQSDEFQERLLAYCRDTLGRPIHVSGGLEMSFYPWFGFRTGPVTVEGGPGFGTTPLLSAESVSVRVKVQSLFTDSLSVDVVELDRPQLNLVRDGSGRGNWEGLFPSSPSAQLPGMGEDGLGLHLVLPGQFTIRGLAVTNATVHFDDQAGGQRYDFSGLDCRTGRIAPGRPVAFTLQTGFESATRDLEAEFELSGQAEPGANGGLTLPRAEVQARVRAGFLPETAREGVLAGTLELDPEAGQAVIRNLSLQAAGLRAKGMMAVRDFLTRPRAEGDLQVEEFSPRRFLEHHAPGLLAGPAPGLLESAALAAKVAVDQDGVTLHDLVLRLDGAALSGRVALADFHAPRLDLDLEADVLDLDRYAPLFREKDAARPKAQGQAAGGKSGVAARILPGFAVRAGVRAGEVRFLGESVRQVDLSLEGSPARLSLAVKECQALGGKLSGQAKAERQGEGEAAPLRLTANVRLADAPAARLPWNKDRARLTGGTVGLDLALDARGAAWEDFAPNSAGNLKVRTSGCRLVLPGDVPASSPAAPPVKPAAQTPARPPAKGAPRAPARPAPKAPAETPQPGSILLTQATANLNFRPLKGPGIQLKPGETPFGASLDLDAAGRDPDFGLALRTTGLAVLGRDYSLVRLADAQTEARLTGGFLPWKIREAAVSAVLSLDPAAQSVSLERLRAAAPALLVQGRLDGRRVLEKDAAWNGPLELLVPDMPAFLKTYGIEKPLTKDAGTFSKAALKADVSSGPEAVALQNLSVSMDGGAAKGQVTIRRTGDPQVLFSLKADSLDLDRYLQPPPPRGQRAPAVDVAEDMLRSLSCEGDLAADWFRMKDAVFRNAKAHFRAGGGLLSLAPFTADFYGGTFRGEFLGKVSETDLSLGLDMAMERFSAGDFMQDYAGRPYVKGTASMSFRLKGKGPTDDAIMADLDGTAGFLVENGSYKFSGWTDKPDPRPNREKGMDLGSSSDGRQPFSQAKGDFTVKSGLFTTNNFTMDAQALSARGKGSFSPAANTVNLLIEADFIRVAGVPILINGKLYDPQVSIPKAELLTKAVKDVLGLPLKPLQYLRDLFF